MRIVNPVGKKGEDEAVKYLVKKGYKILDRNFRKRNGEIDIVATKGSILVFVEVKTRTTSQFGSPFEAITPWKLRTVIKTAEFYKISHKNLPDEMRMDAISVLLDGLLDVEEIEHLENISGF